MSSAAEYDAPSLLSDIVDCQIWSDFERQIIGGMREVHDKNVSVSRVSTFQTTEATVHRRKTLSEHIKTTLAGKSAKHWKDHAKLEKGKIEPIQDIECDFYARFSGEDDIMAEDLLGHTVDKSVMANHEDDNSWRSINLKDKLFMLEVTAKPEHVRHKMYQLARAALEFCHSGIEGEKDFNLERISLMAISLNGKVEDFNETSTAIKAHWKSFWDFETKNKSLKWFLRKFSKIPLVLLWTERRNVHHSITTICREISSIRREISSIRREISSIRREISSLKMGMGLMGFILVYICIEVKKIGSLLSEAETNGFSLWGSGK